MVAAMYITWYRREVYVQDQWPWRKDKYTIGK